MIGLLRKLPPPPLSPPLRELGRRVAAALLLIECVEDVIVAIDDDGEMRSPVDLFFDVIMVAQWRRHRPK